MLSLSLYRTTVGAESYTAINYILSLTQRCNMCWALHSTVICAEPYTELENWRGMCCSFCSIRLCERSDIALDDVFSLMLVYCKNWDSCCLRMCAEPRTSLEYILSTNYPHVVKSVLHVLQMEVIVPRSHTKDRTVGLFRLPWPRSTVFWPWWFSPSCYCPRNMPISMKLTV